MRSPVIRIALDLEMENDGPHEGEIIQIGYTIFCAKTSRIIFTGGDYISCGFELSEKIKKLTKISDEEISKRGVGLHYAYLQMINNFERILDQEYQKLISENPELANRKDFNKESLSFRKIIEWGYGDYDYLLGKLREHYPHSNFGTDPYFGRKTMDIKASCQAYFLVRNINIKGGLKSSCKKLRIGFESFIDKVSEKHTRQRGSHDARADALNTVRVYLEIFKPSI